MALHQAVSCVHYMTKVVATFRVRVMLQACAGTGQKACRLFVDALLQLTGGLLENITAINIPVQLRYVSHHIGV